MPYSRPSRCSTYARAHDAVHEAVDFPRLAAALGCFGLPVVMVASAAQDRQTYLMRPDLYRAGCPHS